MNRFVTFFLVSFILHVAVGAVLLSRTGILGSGGTDEVELNNLEEVPEELGESNEAKKPEVLDTEVVPEKAKPRPKAKKKVVNKKKTVKPKVIKPAPIKEQPPVKKPEPSIVEKLKTVEKIPSTEPLDTKPVETKAEEANSVEPQQEEKPKTPEAEATTSDASTEQAQKKEKWVDEEEIIEEKKEEAPVSETLEQDVQEETEKDLEDEEKTKNPAPPQNEQEPASTKSSGSVDKDVSSLDAGAARSHSQLRQLEGNPMPAYPKEALKKKWEGRAEVFYYVNPAGFVEKIQLKSSSGHSVLDNAALRAIARYRYHPGQEGWVRHPVEFVLDFDKEVKEIAPLGVRDSASQK